MSINCYCASENVVNSQLCAPLALILNSPVKKKKVNMTTDKMRPMTDNQEMN